MRVIRTGTSTKKQTHKLMEQNREPRNKPTHIGSFNGHIVSFNGHTGSFIGHIGSFIDHIGSTNHWQGYQEHTMGEE